MTLGEVISSRSNRTEERNRQDSKVSRLAGGQGRAVWREAARASLASWRLGGSPDHHRASVPSRSTPAHREDRLEAAQDKAFGVERRLPGRIQAPILVHLCFGGFEARLVGPDLPGEDDLLARL